MIEFRIKGPIPVPTYKKSGIRHFDKDQEKTFWETCKSALPDLPKLSGCYIFCMQTKSLKPWYVGKTSKGYQHECFKPHQLTKLNHFINDHGTPVIFFAYKKFKNKESKKTKSTILHLEKFLIQAAKTSNPELRNFQGTKALWNIRGSIHSEPIKGPKPDDLGRFQQMLRL